MAIQTSNPPFPRPASSNKAGESARSRPVSLEVPVLLRGLPGDGATAEVVPPPFSEETRTMIVFASGAVVRASANFSLGQRIRVTNLATQKEILCRIVQIRSNPNVQAHVEIEFLEPAVGFWGIYFPSDAGLRAASAVPAESSPVLNEPPSAISKAAAESVSRPEVSASANTNAASKPSTPTQSEPAQIQVLAAPHEVGTAPAKTGTMRATTSEKPAVETSRAASTTPGHDGVKAATPVTYAAPSHNRAEGIVSVADSIKGVKPVVPPASQAAARTALVGPTVPPQVARPVPVPEKKPSASIAVQPAAKMRSNVALPTFGSTLLPARESEAPARDERPRRTIVYAAAGVVVLAAAIAGGIYLRDGWKSPVAENPGASPSTSSVLSSSAVTPAPSPAAAIQAGEPPAPPASTTGKPEAQPLNANAGAPVATPPTPNAKSEKTASNTAKQSEAPPQPPPAQSIAAQPASRPALALKLSAPKAAAPRNVNAAGEEPPADASVEAANATNAAGLGGIVSSNTQASQLGAPARPVSAPTAPKLLSSVAPVYPLMAKQRRIEGDVLIDALIDVKGRVTEMKVISGPMLLQQAAMDALRAWKYEPAKSNGEPTATHQQVRIQFKLQ